MTKLDVVVFNSTFILQARLAVAANAANLQPKSLQIQFSHCCLFICLNNRVHLQIHVCIFQENANAIIMVI